MTEISDYGKTLLGTAMDRRVARSDFGDSYLSTVFLAPAPHAPRGVWETMIVGGVYHGREWHWDSAEDAVRGHRRIADDLAAGRDPGVAES